MFSTNLNKISIFKQKSVNNDVTPDAIDWTEGSYLGDIAYTTVETITGINTSINLTIEYYDDVIENSSFEYNKNTSGWSVISTNPPASATTTTISVANNDTLQFRYSTVAATGILNVTVKNASDGNTTLDTFQLTAYIPPE